MIIYIRHNNKIVKAKLEILNNDMDEINNISLFNSHIEYDCQLKNGSFEGKGETFYNNANLKYEGEWKNNKPNGKGIFYYGNGKKNMIEEHMLLF